MADTRTARRQPQAAWYSRFMVSASSAWVPALAPAGQGPFICPGELNSPGIKVFPSGKHLYGAKRRPAPRGPCESAHPLTSDLPDTVVS